MVKTQFNYNSKNFYLLPMLAVSWDYKFILWTGVFFWVFIIEGERTK